MTKTTQRTSRRASTHRSPEGQDVALAAVLGTLLVGFVLVAAREIGATLGIVEGGHGDSYQLFAVSLTGLVGGVFALAMGASRRTGAITTDDDPRRRFFSAAYVLTYVTAGAIALLVCLVRLGSSTVILRSLAAAFLGTAVTVASAYFRTDLQHPPRSGSSRR
jgi:MFS family permease